MSPELNSDDEFMDEMVTVNKKSPSVSSVASVTCANASHSSEDTIPESPSIKQCKPVAVEPANEVGVSPVKKDVTNMPSTSTKTHDRMKRVAVWFQKILVLCLVLLFGFRIMMVRTNPFILDRYDRAHFAFLEIDRAVETWMKRRDEALFALAFDVACNACAILFIMVFFWPRQR